MHSAVARGSALGWKQPSEISFTFISYGRALLQGNAHSRIDSSKPAATYQAQGDLSSASLAPRTVGTGSLTIRAHLLQCRRPAKARAEGFEVGSAWKAQLDRIGRRGGGTG